MFVRLVEAFWIEFLRIRKVFGVVVQSKDRNENLGVFFNGDVCVRDVVVLGTLAVQ